MPAVAAKKWLITPEEYFDWEETQETAHEYAYGEVFPMPGGTAEHFIIIGNWVRLLGNALLDAGATVFPDGMRVQIHDERYVYPDVSVVMEPTQFRDESRRVLTNPTVVIEVLSESTAAYDRGEKFALYREVESLRDIVWIDSERRWAEVASRTNGVWTLPGPITNDQIELPSLELTISFDDLYRGVDELA
ncbi:MAG: Uma2 family endonuclease [Rubricoccaceae bacterium]